MLRIHIGDSLGIPYNGKGGIGAIAINNSKLAPSLGCKIGLQGRPGRVRGDKISIYRKSIRHFVVDTRVNRIRKNQFFRGHSLE
jgi:hypothetical protein